MNVRKKNMLTFAYRNVSTLSLQLKESTNCLVGLALLRKSLKFIFGDSWGYVEFSKDSKTGLGIVLAQKTKKLGASKALASTLQRPKN